MFMKISQWIFSLMSNKGQQFELNPLPIMFALGILYIGVQVNQFSEHVLSSETQNETRVPCNSLILNFISHLWTEFGCN